MSLHKKSVADVAVSGKKVLLRCDFNVPLQNGVIADETRITSALPTILQLFSQWAAVILCSHIGRPKGQVDPKYSLRPVAERLSELLNQPVELAQDVTGQSARALAASLQPGQVMLLENLRFRPEEEKNDPGFCRELASLADLYVNDAFGAAHRAHASTAGVAAYLPAVSGFLMQREIDVMGKALEHPDRPFVAILGGAKVADKLALIENLLDKCDSVLIGGGMSYTFSRAMGGSIGCSLCDESKLDTVRSVMDKAREKGVQLLLPVDIVCGKSFDNDTDRLTVPAGQIPDGYEGFDIGPETRKLYADVIAKARTVVWNGPMGAFELPVFAEGTRAVARAVAESSAVSIIGGGDSASAIEQLGFADKVTHISTGGGASLEFLEGRELPGVACLLDK